MKSIIVFKFILAIMNLTAFGFIILPFLGSIHQYEDYTGSTKSVSGVEVLLKMAMYDITISLVFSIIICFIILLFNDYFNNGRIKVKTLFFRQFIFLVLLSILVNLFMYSKPGFF